MSSILQNKALLAAAGVVVVGAVAFAAYNYTQSEDSTPSTSGSSQTEATSETADKQSQTSVGDQTVEGALVDGFPGAKVPLYLGDVVESKRSSDSYGKPEYNVRIQTSDDMQKVVDRTETSYMNEGWEIKTRPTATMFVAHSTEHIVTVSFHEASEGVLINYGVSTK